MSIPIGSSVIPDLRPAKSPKRFLASLTPTRMHFTQHDDPPPLPDMPSTRMFSSNQSMSPSHSFLKARKKTEHGSSPSKSSFSSGDGQRQPNGQDHYPQPGRPTHRPFPSLGSLASTMTDGESSSSSTFDSGWDSSPIPGRSLENNDRAVASFQQRGLAIKNKTSLPALPIEASLQLPPLKHMRSKPSVDSWFHVDAATMELSKLSGVYEDASGYGRSITRSKSSRDLRRETIKPSPRSPVPALPFAATLTSKISRPSPTTISATLVILEFAFSLDDPPNISEVTIPWPLLSRAGGHLAGFVRSHLVPGLADHTCKDAEECETLQDGSDEDFDLAVLLRDEYLSSVLMSPATDFGFLDLPGRTLLDSTESELDFPPLPPTPVKQLTLAPCHPKATAPVIAKKRAAKRNQYTQQDYFPSPASPLAPRTISLAARRKTKPLRVDVSEQCGGGTITQLKVLIPRNASIYHVIAARLLTGSFPSIEGKRRELEEECKWLGMDGLLGEIWGGKRQKSLVLQGGGGYI